MPALALAPFCDVLAEEAERTLIRINIPGPRSLPFLPIELIPLLGIDRRLNARLIIRYFPSGVRALEDMLVGNAQFTAQGFTILHAFHSKGKPIKAIAQLSGDVPPFGLVIRADLRGQIRSVADLKGKSIGVSVGSANSKTYMQQMVEIYLAANKISPDEIRWVPTAQNWEGQHGALGSKSVDAVFCEEPFLTGLVRNGVGFTLSDISDAKIKAVIPGATHLRAALTTTTENLQQNPQITELMVQMLQQSLDWLFKANASDIVKRLNIDNRQERRDLFNVLARHRATYARDARFSRQQIEATVLYMRAAGLLVEDSAALYAFIDSQFAGVKP